MEQTGGSDAVLLTPADVARETTVQAQKSPLIPACVEEQLLNAPQVIADLASPVGAQPQYLQPQASSAQQPSPTTQVAPQQPCDTASSATAATASTSQGYYDYTSAARTNSSHASQQHQCINSGGLYFVPVKR